MAITTTVSTSPPKGSELNLDTNTLSSGVVSLARLLRESLGSDTNPEDLQPPSPVQPYVHANLYIQLFIPHDSSYHYVTSPEFCNLIGAFTAILLAQDISRMSPDPLPRTGRDLGTRLYQTSLPLVGGAAGHETILPDPYFRGW